MEIHNLDSNAYWGTFNFARPASISIFCKDPSKVSDVLITNPGVSWWPKGLKGNVRSSKEVGFVPLCRFERYFDCSSARRHKIFLGRQRLETLFINDSIRGVSSSPAKISEGAVYDRSAGYHHCPASLASPRSGRLNSSYVLQRRSPDPATALPSVPSCGRDRANAPRHIYASARICRQDEAHDEHEDDAAVVRRSSLRTLLE